MLFTFSYHIRLDRRKIVNIQLSGVPSKEGLLNVVGIR